MRLAGTDAFIKQVIEVAARQNMHIEFADPAQSALMEELKNQIQKGREYAAKHQAKDKIPDAHETQLQAEPGKEKRRADAKAPVPGKEVAKPSLEKRKQSEQDRRDDDPDQERDREIDVPR
ncbi:MAG: hypothetical protein NVSMB6_01780 [Burkholderiaceae bacterium]